MGNEWTKEHPIPPDNGSLSDWYWYYDIKEKEYWVIEIWPNRYLDHFNGWWWPISIKKPPKIILPTTKQRRRKSKRKKNHEGL